MGEAEAPPDGLVGDILRVLNDAICHMYGAAIFLIISFDRYATIRISICLTRASYLAVEIDTICSTVALLVNRHSVLNLYHYLFHFIAILQYFASDAV